MNDDLDYERLAEIAKRLHEDGSNDSANCNELLEILEMLGFDPDTGERMGGEIEREQPAPDTMEDDA